MNDTQESRPRFTCPACGSDMRSRSLASQFSIRPYRVCPDCGARYTTDRQSRRRQWSALLLVAIALFLVALLAMEGTAWLLPVLFSQLVLWVYVGYAISKVTYVEFKDR